MILYHKRNWLKVFASKIVIIKLYKVDFFISQESPKDWHQSLDWMSCSHDIDSKRVKWIFWYSAIMSKCKQPNGEAIFYVNIIHMWSSINVSHIKKKERCHKVWTSAKKLRNLKEFKNFAGHRKCAPRCKFSRQQSGILSLSNSTSTLL